MDGGREGDRKRERERRTYLQEDREREREGEREEREANLFTGREIGRGICLQGPCKKVTLNIHKINILLEYQDY